MGANVKKRPSALPMGQIGTGKRRRIISVPKKDISSIAAAMSKSEHVPKQVAKMLGAVIGPTLSVVKAHRHRFQSSIVGMMSSTLDAREHELERALHETQTKLDGFGSEETKRKMAVEEAARIHTCSREAEAAKRKIVVDAAAAVKEATSSLAECKQKQIANHTDLKAAYEQKKRIDDIVKETYEALKEYGAEGAPQGSIKSLLKLKPHLNFSSFSLLVTALQKSPGARVALDTIVLQEFESETQKHVSALAKSAEECLQAQDSLAAAVSDKTAELEAATAKHTSEKALLVEAQEATKRGALELRAAKRSVASLGKEARNARSALKTAEADLARFKRGPLAVFLKHRDRALPLEEGSEQTINILKRIHILPHGVLGAQLGRDKRIVQHEEPDSQTVFVDPAGLHHIQPPGGPAGAGGAARAIYKFLRIDRDSEFPPDVVAAVKRTGDAKYHAYGPEKNAIHAVGPDLRGLFSSDGVRNEVPMPPSKEDAIEELSTAYCNIFQEFITSGLPRLWLLPISSGIFAGSFKDEMPDITMTALQRGYSELLSQEQRKALLSLDISLCIFEERELPEFEEALLGAIGEIAVA